jgi:hypothetical protein
VRFLDYICVCNIERFLLVEFVVNQMDFLWNEEVSREVTKFSSLPNNNGGTR